VVGERFNIEAKFAVSAVPKGEQFAVLCDNCSVVFAAANVHNLVVGRNGGYFHRFRTLEDPGAEAELAVATDTKGVEPSHLAQSQGVVASTRDFDNLEQDKWIILEAAAAEATVAEVAILLNFLPARMIAQNELAACLKALCLDGWHA
jgi:hypothetical protein